MLTASINTCQPDPMEQQIHLHRTEISFQRQLFSLGLHKFGDLFNELCIKPHTTLQHLNALDPGGGGGVLPNIRYIGMCRPKGIVFEPFWSENGYRF